MERGARSGVRPAKRDMMMDGSWLFRGTQQPRAVILDRASSYRNQRPP